MKKQLFAATAVIVAGVFSFVSCNDSFHSEPVVPKGQVSRTGSPPENVSASHGQKRSITLSWNQMSGAVLYYVYSAASPLAGFVRCGETTANQITFNVQPGSTVYYRVSSVSLDNKESSQGAYVKGTSLAQPVITDITEITESGAAVTWYMDNVSEDTYKNNLLYTVYCFNGTTEVAQIALDGAVISENRAFFAGLSANTRYEYQVEAYLRSDQDASEKSEKMDSATARRFRPGAPGKLKVARGTAVDKIEVSFELPDMVDIALGDNLFDPKPLYFVIFKRLYSETRANEYLKVCSYFGSIANNAVKSGGKTFVGYLPGSPVKWVDENVIRGLEYEYLVQSYVDDTTRQISSDDSKLSASGWALSEGFLSFNDIEYQRVPDQDLFGSAKLPLDFDFDPKGEAYSYTLVERIEPIDDGDANDPDDEIYNRIPFSAHDAVRAHVPAMNLTQKTDTNNPGRGLYSYAVEIRLAGEQPESDPLDVIETIGKVEVSENTQPLVVERFGIQDGFADKFVLRWYYRADRKYVVYESLNRNGPWAEVETINNAPNDDENYSWTYSGQTAGAVKYFAVQPFRALGGNEFKQGQMVYASAVARTLGVPKISQGGDPSYSTVTALWTEAQKADTYRIKYWYTEEGANAAVTAATVKANELSLDAAGHFKFTFSPFAGDVDVSKAGLEMQIAVDALNEGLRAAVGGDEIVTTSAEEVKIHLVGPALLNLSASKAASTSEITVSWNAISGADGYYVFRRQFNMTNTAEEEEKAEAVVYYVSASQSSPTVTGKNLLVEGGTKDDTSAVKASVSFTGSGYQLQDIYLPDSDYKGSIYNRHTPEYRDQQNNLAQGYPYRYYVVPVVKNEPLTSIDFVYGKDGSNKNTNITSYTIRENNVNVRYTGAASVEQEGFAIGFGQNVVATKGTYVSSGNVNDGIEITWNPPPRLSTVAGFDPRYTLYRRAPGGGSWTAATSNLSEKRYIDTTPERGFAYEYLVGINNGGSGIGSLPQSSQRFIDLCYTLRDGKDRPNMLGFMLKMVKMDSVSRNEIKVGNDFAEEVKWPSAGIINSASQDPNWGIDGYMVFVMNRNNDAGWHEIADISNIPNQTDQSVRVTNGTGLLKVLRDYKHYFKVRSYVTKDGEKIYCPDPPYDYEALYAADRSKFGQEAYRADQHKLETEYVKWGARQVTHTEYVRIATLAMAWGIHEVNSGRTGWVTAISGRTKNANGNNGSSGSIRAESSSGVGMWWFDISNYRPDMDTNANRGDWSQSVTFVTIDTNSNSNGNADQRKRTIYAETSASSQYPRFYGWLLQYRTGLIGTKYDYGTEFFDVKGPADTPNLYTGKMKFDGPLIRTSEGDGSGGLRGDWQDNKWLKGGWVAVKYPANADEVRVEDGELNTPLPFHAQPTNPSYRQSLDAWY